MLILLTMALGSEMALSSAAARTGSFSFGWPSMTCRDNLEACWKIKFPVLGTCQEENGPRKDKAAGVCDCG